jgi:23S rRNA (cytidine2498-2'-O)-methyltransferase
MSRLATVPCMLDISLPNFVFVTCQLGAERAVKFELARTWPDWRLAYSRGGFLTFKIPQDHKLAADFQLDSAVFARAAGFSIGRAVGATTEERAHDAWRLAAQRPYRALHVWQVDTALPGNAGFEPGQTSLAIEADTAIRRAAQSVRGAVHTLMTHPHGETPSRSPASRGQLVLDCVLVRPDEWWIGFHRVSSQTTRWPGGLKPIAVPPDALSRAYLKMEEALWWSQLPIRAGDACVEVGSAPGGASQALLRRGLRVTGIDPARMDTTLTHHPHFQHVQKRGAHVKRRDFAPFRWLVADMNVAPKYTLDTVEAIVTHRAVHIRGLLLTLKLTTWDIAQQLPNWMARIQAWGYRDVRARQLAHNRQELCVIALKHRSLRRVEGRGLRVDPSSSSLDQQPSAW